jgi:type I restriction enzyme S subunit
MIGRQGTFLDHLPSGWSFDRLKDVVALRNDKTAEASAEEDYLELEDLESGTGRIIRRRNTLQVESAVTVFQKGDVLFGKLRTYLEKYYQADFDGKCTGEILAFQPLRITSRFLFYCVGSPWFIQLCNALAYGAKMPRVSWTTQLSQFHVPLPPVAEQHVISVYLDASCAAIDAAVTTKRKQIEMLDSLRLDAVSLAVTRGLSHSPKLRRTSNAWMARVPAHWDLVSLKRVADIQGGLTLGKVYEGSLIERPYLRVANVQDGHLDLDEITTIEVPAAVAARVELRVGDVLMTEGGDLDKLGRGTIWNGEIPDCLHQNHIFAVRCLKHKLLPQFLAHLTTSRFGRDYFEATGKRTTNLASTNSTKVGLFPIPRPPLKEQQVICAYLDTRFAELASIKRCIESQIEALSSYRKSLIHECVTGQRRIADEDLNRVTVHG